MNKNKKMEKITSRETNFSQWYTNVVVNAKLIEYGPVKGTIIFRPYGYAIWENMQKILDAEFKKLGVENVYFPLLIPESLFLKEAKHIEGFAPEVATVTQVGNKVLEEKLFIRPTSEVLLADFFQKEVKSYRDLPLIYNQWVNVMRWEKTTRPFLRTSEFLWQEGHTLHNNPEEAEKFTLKILDIYQKFLDQVLMCPVIAGKKTEFEKFAGAKDTYTIEALMHDGQALQSGTSHYFADNFSRAYDIKFQNKNGDLEYAYGTSWGVSTRLIGALIMIHSDDFGLVLPSKIAPIQIAIIPVNDEPEVLKTAQSLATKLGKYKIKVDETEKSFGFKISEAEIKGIPLRIEIGPRDLAQKQVTISRRDQRTKMTVKLTELNKKIDSLMTEYDQNLYDLALKNLKSRISHVETLPEYVKQLKEKQGFVLVPFCGRVECEQDVKKKTSTNSRCIPFDVEQTPGKCFNCKMDSKLRVYFARAY